MNSSVIQLLVLAGIALFLILRLRNVLGAREGFEKPPIQQDRSTSRQTARDFEVIEGGPDPDIVDHVDENSPAAAALAEMKRVDPNFSVSEFLQGARGAYEMILMAFENGDLASIQPYISDDVYEAFDGVVRDREEKGLTIEANFIGVSEMSLKDAEFDSKTNEAELTMKFMSELTYQVWDKAGDVIEGNDTDIKRQKDVWIFARVMGTDDPNWRLVATGK